MRKAYEPEKKVFAYNKRDTKRWCKGVVGREHVPTWKFLPPWDGPWSKYPSGKWQQKVCKVCGKHLLYMGRHITEDGVVTEQW